MVRETRQPFSGLLWPAGWDLGESAGRVIFLRPELTVLLLKRRTMTDITTIVLEQGARYEARRTGPSNGQNAMKATEIKNLFRDTDSFTRGYIVAALWSTTGPAFGECPCCGERRLLNKWPEEQYEREEMCSGPKCGARPTNHEPALDENYSWTDIAPETLQRMLDDCAKFQAEQDLSGYPSEQAGHDFWLTRAGHGCGFFEHDYGTEEQCDKLTEVCEQMGEFYLYPGDDGRLYGN